MSQIYSTNRKFQSSVFSSKIALYVKIGANILTKRVFPEEMEKT